MSENKVVVITGASSGIGRATANLLAQKGAKVVLGARREDKLKEIVNEIGDNAAYSVTDVTKRNDIKKLFQLALEKFGRIDVLYNNAGIMPQGPLADAEYDQWKQALDINIMGVLNGIGEILPIMKKQKDGGLIITTDSVAGHVIYPGSAVYNGTKFAIRAIMEGLRQEEKSNGIRSTIVSPGAVNTGLIDTIGNEDIKNYVGQLMKAPREDALALNPEDIAKAVLFAVEQPKEVTVSEMIVRPSNQQV